MLRFSWHSIPFLSGENPIGFPVRKIWGTSHTLHGSQQVTTAAGMGIVALGAGAALYLRRPKRA
jgi:hypothetical protein